MAAVGNGQEGETLESLLAELGEAREDLAEKEREAERLDAAASDAEREALALLVPRYERRFKQQVPVGLFADLGKLTPIVTIRAIQNAVGSGQPIDAQAVARAVQELRAEEVI